MLKQSVLNYLENNDFKFERFICEYEVFRNTERIVIIHPTLGIRLFYLLDLFDKYYTESVIEMDLRNLDKLLR